MKLKIIISQIYQQYDIAEISVETPAYYGEFPTQPIQDYVGWPEICFDRKHKQKAPETYKEIKLRW